MEFRTKIPIIPQDPKIGYDSRILLLGSCFVKNIGKKLEYFKFQTLLNPFGILFHPAAIVGFLERVKEGNYISETDIFYHNERWHSFDAHSSLSHPDKDQMLEKLNTAVEETRQFIQNASHVIVTPGSAWAYDLLETGQTVANCHKLPQKNFRKELKKVKSDLARCVEIIHSMNPEANVIFTVSPVRHLKDGFIENQRSKSKLITAVHKIAEDSSSEGKRLSFYFPSYEIMMDELRDYRFYAEDMMHPNSVALDYIWENFVQAWIDSEVVSIMGEVHKIQKGLSHRPFNGASDAHQKFLHDLRNRIGALQEKFPHMNF